MVYVDELLLSNMFLAVDDKKNLEYKKIPTRTNRQAMIINVITRKNDIFCRLRKF
jgi:hypothetical protein